MQRIDPGGTRRARPARGTQALAVIALVAALAGCRAGACAPERLPNEGVAATTDQLYHLVQHAAQHDCTRVLYDALSDRTRREHSYLKIWLFLDSLRVPEPYDYLLMDVLARGSYVAHLPGPGGRELALVSYEEPGKPELLAQILVVEELDPEGRAVRRLAIEEQLEEGPPMAADEPGVWPTGG